MRMRQQDPTARIFFGILFAISSVVGYEQHGLLFVLLAWASAALLLGLIAIRVHHRNRDGRDDDASDRAITHICMIRVMPRFPMPPPNLPRAPRSSCVSRAGRRAGCRTY